MLTHHRLIVGLKRIVGPRLLVNHRHGPLNQVHIHPRFAAKARGGFKTPPCGPCADPAPLHRIEFLGGRQFCLCNAWLADRWRQSHIDQWPHHRLLAA